MIWWKMSIYVQLLGKILLTLSCKSGQNLFTDKHYQSHISIGWGYNASVYISGDYVSYSARWSCDQVA